MPGEPAIQTRDLSKRYGAQVAVDRLNLSVAEGEVFGFLGPNGAGKTTTLLMLLGLTEPTSGEARVLGLDPRRQPIRVKRQVGYLQENMGFYRDLDARQMLAFIAELNDLPAAEAGERAEAALAAVGLAGEAGKKIGAYSRGMRQRLGLAEILLKQPRVAFLDEPTIGLDPDGTARMLEVIERLARERGMTVLLCSHLLEQVERISTRIGIMIGGRLVAQGSLGELRAAKFGVAGQEYTLEEIYLRYFRESVS
jgi:ABC-2 type transport system ATP-binding protein